MKNAIFRNFTDKPFTGYWNGRARTFKPGSETFMEEGLARHFAKHLVNHVLLTEPDPVIRKMNESYTSPKNPEQVPAFMNLFNQAFQLDDEAEEQDAAQAAIDAANRPEANRAATDHLPKPAGAPIVVDVPEDDDDAFEGEEKPAAAPQQADQRSGPVGSNIGTK